MGKGIIFFNGSNSTASNCCADRRVDLLEEVSVTGALADLSGLIFLLGAAVVPEVLDLSDFWASARITAAGALELA